MPLYGQKKLETPIVLNIPVKMDADTLLGLIAIETIGKPTIEVGLAYLNLISEGIKPDIAKEILILATKIKR